MKWTAFVPTILYCLATIWLFCNEMTNFLFEYEGMKCQLTCSKLKGCSQVFLVGGWGKVCDVFRHGAGGAAEEFIWFNTQIVSNKCPYASLNYILDLNLNGRKLKS